MPDKEQLEVLSMIHDHCCDQEHCEGCKYATTRKSSRTKCRVRDLAWQLIFVPKRWNMKELERIVNHD